MSDPVAILSKAINVVVNSEGVPAKEELLAVLDESLTWERRCISYSDVSQSDKLMVFYAEALIRELVPGGTE
ncbi:hypothetical protein [Paenarthrobacter ureafaciens]|uniref:hypothetical protein n=1 Tax=Paenarthrobacter ureafaciens TaxID=37931 RepID=UPI0009AD7FB0|nr:hypothetical protein [Paenarthrobacter ureafaciens]GLU58600.1 hypothetical protein Pure01_11130 [Paenarthrobacter ureafaciens]GLU61845.1 hypothetical protein Pure02_00950 [Paenarthrobacter ureafaciens]GLU66119.1 hypothetical protein Pure03_00950 [Paenarthrobacter ureafaciens]GLU71557.1 hypothetical protein Pure04_12720 [Paenarthrobacter ureafaciens]GLU74656.1 hypothetical protein Pure05_00960 [Paenarthrobacter ureafaciens]